jgi:hypothetical protein
MTTHEQPGAEQVQDQILRHLNAHQSIKNTMVEIHSDSQMVLGILKSLASRSVIFVQDTRFVGHQ